MCLFVLSAHVGCRSLRLRLCCFQEAEWLQSDLVHVHYLLGVTATTPMQWLVSHKVQRMEPELCVLNVDFKNQQNKWSLAKTNPGCDCQDRPACVTFSKPHSSNYNMWNEAFLDFKESCTFLAQFILVCWVKMNRNKTLSVLPFWYSAVFVWRNLFIEWCE